MYGKHVVFSFLILAGFTSTPTFNKNQPIANVNKAEYANLLAKCREARKEVILYWDKAMKDGIQQVRGQYDLYIQQVKANYAAIGAQNSLECQKVVAAAEQKFNQDAAKFIADIKASIHSYIATTLTQCLQQLGTPIALQLLNDLIKVNFVF